MESSRRDLFSDMDEHRATSKNVQNTDHRRFSFIPKTGISFSKGSCHKRQNHNCQRRKRQLVTAKEEKSQTPKFVTAILT